MKAREVGIESGVIQLDVKTVRGLTNPLREWTNRIHSAAMHEVLTLSQDIPGTDSGLQIARDAVRAAWVRRLADQPTTRRLTDLLALNALNRHQQECASSGRWRKPTAKILDELLPKRSARDTYFRVPDLHGDVPAGMTLDYDSFVWHAEPSDGRPASAARESPLGVIAFSHLGRVVWKPGMGGVISGPNGRVVMTFPPSG